MKCSKCGKELNKRKDYFLKFTNGKYVCTKCLERKNFILSLNNEFNSFIYKNKNYM